MDQVRKLYEELAQYDPSLQNDKEAVLQVIEKMLAAKPMIVADPQRKDRFGEQLTEHIAKRKMLLPAKTGFSFRVAKRGFSFATFFLVMLVAGGAYIVLRMDVISNKKNIGLKNHAQIKTDAQDSNVAIDAQVDNQVAVGNDGEETFMSNDKEKVLSDKHFMNADLALRNTNTIRVADSVHIPNIIPSVEMSTNVDILSVAQNVMSTGGAGGGNPDETVMYDAGAKTMMATEISVNDKNAKQQSTDSTASMPPAAMMQQKMIAMVFVNDDTLGGESFSIDILKVYAIPASFIESDNDASLRVKIGSHQYVDLRGKSLQDVKISMTENHVIVLRSSEVMKDPSKLTMLIEKLQAEGYTFVNLSAMQK